VYLDGRLVATLDRRLGESGTTLPAMAAPARLDILVENTGRVNYTTVIRTERKGITHKVSLAGNELTGWQIYRLPMDNLAASDPHAIRYREGECIGPCFYRTTVDMGDKPADTYLDASALGKGEVFVNGRALGRFWKVGPQTALYLPAPWTHAGANEIDLFELEGAGLPTLSTRKAPVWETALQ